MRPRTTPRPSIAVVMRVRPTVREKASYDNSLDRNDKMKIDATPFLRLVRPMVSGVALALCISAHAQTVAWKPAKPVEIIVGVSPGGSMDRTARDIHKIFQDKSALPVSSLVVNKPGGGHAVALSYLALHAADAHYLQVVNTTLLTNRILGRSPIHHADYTAIAMLFDEAQAFAVPADSPIRNGRDLIERLRKDPASVSISISTGVGTANQLAAVLMAKAGGIDLRKLKTVAFNSASEGVTATLGSHIDVVITTPFSIMPFVKTGKLRFIAIAVPRRMGGDLAQVPTWREQGIDSVVGAWRAVIAPRGLTETQVAYWDGIFAELVRSAEWRADLQKNYLLDTYMPSGKVRQFFDSEYGSSSIPL